MEGLLQKPNAIEITVLPRWDKVTDKQDENEPQVVELHSQRAIKFPIRNDINEKIILWQGDIRLVDVDAVVNSTNESMTDSTGISGAILEAAGPELREEITKTEQCRTGEARITRGYNLPSRWIIHTVGPRYNEKYKTAAENALHNCYRSSLEVLKENNLRNIAFPVINSQKRGYPAEPGCHIAVRTVRRFLEHWGRDIDTVIFCVSNSADFGLYTRVLPLYFPRNVKELLTEKEELPRDVGNEFGETVIEERKIRISAFPGNVMNSSVVDAPIITPTVTDIPSTPIVSTTSEHLPGNFAMMKADFDEERKKKFDQMTKEDRLKLEQQQLYYDYLYKAMGLDLSDIARLNVIYESGKDAQGRPVVVIVGSRLPTQRHLLDRVFLYMLKVMDKITDHHYSVVYVHTNMEDKDTPEFSWMKKVYNIIDSKYGDNLSSFFIIHPTFWLKIFEGVVSTFMVSENFWSKVKYVEKLEEIYDTIDHEQLVLPEEVLQYDIKINGRRPIVTARKAFAVGEAEYTVNEL